MLEQLRTGQERQEGFLGINLAARSDGGQGAIVTAVQGRAPGGQRRDPGRRHHRAGRRVDGHRRARPWSPRFATTAPATRCRSWSCVTVIRSRSPSLSSVAECRPRGDGRRREDREHRDSSRRGAERSSRLARRASCRRRARSGDGGALARACSGSAIAFLRTSLDWEYVAEQSRVGAPWYYRLAGVWGGMEGSLLLFSGIVGAAAVLAARRATVWGRWAAAVTVLTLALVDVVLASPFGRLDVPATIGFGMNPILEHPAMAIHPPLLYAGLAAAGGAAVVAVGAPEPWPVGPAVAARFGGAPDRGDDARCRVELHGAGLGWLLGMGSGGEHVAAGLDGGARGDPCRALGRGPAVAPRGRRGAVGAGRARRRARAIGAHAVGARVRRTARRRVGDVRSGGRHRAGWRLARRAASRRRRCGRRRATRDV